MARRKTAEVKKAKFLNGVMRGESIGGAYIAAGGSPNGARQSGSRLLSRADVQADLKKRLSKAMDADEILEGLSQIARGKRPSKIVHEDGQAVAKDGTPVDVRKTRTEYDRRGGYEAMARVRGLLKDGVEPPKAQINVAVVLPQIPVEKIDELLGYLEKAKALDVEGRAV